MYYLDSGDVDSAIKASDRLEGLTEYIPKFYSNEIMTDVLFCTCSLKGDEAAARELYKQLKQYLFGEKTLQTYRTCAPTNCTSTATKWRRSMRSATRRNALKSAISRACANLNAN